MTAISDSASIFEAGLLCRTRLSGRFCRIRAAAQRRCALDDRGQERGGDPAAVAVVEWAGLTIACDHVGATWLAPAAGDVRYACDGTILCEGGNRKEEKGKEVGKESVGHCGRTSSRTIEQVKSCAGKTSG